MPQWNEPWPAFSLIRRIAVDDVSRHNLLAGLASGMMIVNMKTPVILESVVKERISRLDSGDTDECTSHTGRTCPDLLDGERCAPCTSSGQQKTAAKTSESVLQFPLLPWTRLPGSPLNVSDPRFS
jgi:hypothetical protein